MIDATGIQGRRSAKSPWIKRAIGVSILVYLLMIIDLSRIAAALQQASWPFLVGGLVIVLAVRLLLAWQTALALRHGGLAVTTSGALVVNTIAGFYGLFLPAGAAGGVIKWHRFSRDSGRGAEVFTGLFLQKAINLTPILVFGLVAFAIENPFDQSKLLWMGLGALVCCLSAAVFPILLQPSILDALLQLTSGRLPEAFCRRLQKLSGAFIHYRTMPAPMMVKIAAVPPLVQVLTSGLFWMTAQALTFDLPVLSLAWLSAMVMLIQHIPFSLSGLGLREGALVALMPYYGIAPAEAMAFSLILLGYGMLMGFFGGLLEAWEQLTAPSGSGRSFTKDSAQKP